MRAKRTQERAAVRVARKLVSQIRRGRLRPGTQLDSEHRMVEEFGVARATVREALRFLELQGALRIKAGPGGGPVVSVPGADHLASVLSLHLQFADASFRSVVDGNRVLALLVDALHRMSEGAGAEWDEKQRRSALRSYEMVVRAIESEEPEEARSIMEKSLVAAARYWERTAPDELKQPVAWIDSDR